MAADPSRDTPVDLVIRFTAAIPDATIRISSAISTTPLALKQRIREQLPASYASNRIRLISAGRVLPDTAALSKCITIPPPPPRSVEPAGVNDTVKGKAPAREDAVSRVYVHCSIGDSLTPGELASEAEAAENADKALLSNVNTTTTATIGQDAANTSTPAPRGFDRLLSTGFTPADVATLRAQFMAIQAHTHTPDTMPTGNELRALEERWLENDPATVGTAGGGGDTADDGGLEDMLWGNIMGFFWPIAAVCWLMREEGIWTRRMQISVLSGMLVNLTFGFLRITS